MVKPEINEKAKYFDSIFNVCYKSKFLPFKIGFNQILKHILLFVLLILSMKSSIATVYPQLPDSIDGWTAGEQNSFNDKESLYDYIDGGAELYISYGYKTAIISAGIYALAERVQRICGIDHVFANKIHVDQRGMLTGEADEIVELLKKKEVLRRLAQQEKICLLTPAPLTIGSLLALLRKSPPFQSPKRSKSV